MIVNGDGDWQPAGKNAAERMIANHLHFLIFIASLFS